jgi:hypothetical protein
LSGAVLGGMGRADDDEAGFMRGRVERDGSYSLT